MSYTWENGEVITAEKLNQTGNAGALIVNLLPDENDPFSVHLDKTWKEIRDAYISGVAVKIRYSLDSDSYLDMLGIHKVTIPEPEGSYLYLVIILNPAGPEAFTPTTMQTYNENGYPSIQNGSNEDDEESGEPA